MFRTVSPSIIRSLRLYIQHRTIHVLWLLVSKQPQNVKFLLFVSDFKQNWNVSRDCSKNRENVVKIERL